MLLVELLGQKYPRSAALSEKCTRNDSLNRKQKGIVMPKMKHRPIHYQYKRSNYGQQYT